MTQLSALADDLEALSIHAGSQSEHVNNLTLLGDAPTREALECLAKVFTSCLALNYTPEISLDNDLCDIEEIQGMLQGGPLPHTWRVVIHKPKILEALPLLRPNEQRILFLLNTSFVSWARLLGAFKKCEIDFTNPTTIIAAGLPDSFGGNLLWVLPIVKFEGFTPPHDTAIPKLPNSEDVRKLIHVITDQPTSINPASFALTWGNLSLPEATIFFRIYCVLLAGCLAQDIYISDGSVRCSIKGTKRLDLPLEDPLDPIMNEVGAKLTETVSWIYEERAETRQKLIADPLSIDLDPNKSLVSGLSKYLGNALKQAKDRYAFVILDRKDAYYKELRDIMKDVRAQADLYANKIRDLINALFRDLLGVLILIGLSLIAKFDPTKITSLGSSPEIVLFFRALSGYFVLSFFFQLISHSRDVSLSWSESNGWLDLMRDYTSDAELEERFRKPLKARRLTFWVAVFAVGTLYIALAFISWNFSLITKWLLHL